MEKMPFRESTAMDIMPITTHTTSSVSTDWRKGLPVLASKTVILRELRLSDAPLLLAMLTTEEVSRFISPPPTTVEGFERFIVWAHAERQAGRYACFAVVPAGSDTAIGIFQVRQLEHGFASGEWGFAMGSSYWGTGLFAAGAEMILDFAFGQIGVQRLEARAAVRNGRGNGALRKMGAVCEGVLRKSFLRNGEYLDQHLWSILADDWTVLRREESLTIN
jgi:RimJ/RimL family protein N-acetyltransferase